MLGVAGVQAKLREGFSLSAEPASIRNQLTEEADVSPSSVIPRIAAVEAGSPVATALDERTTVLDLSERAHDAVIHPDDPGGLSLGLRVALATRVAATNEDGPLTEYYRAILDTADDVPPEVRELAVPAHQPSSEAGARLIAVVTHADRLTSAPETSTATTIEALQAAGVDDADIVRLTQLIGFVTYQVRVIAGLRLIAE